MDDNTAGATVRAEGLSSGSIVALACLSALIFIVVSLSLVCFLIRRSRLSRSRSVKKRVEFKSPLFNKGAGKDAITDSKTEEKTDAIINAKTDRKIEKTVKRTDSKTGARTDTNIKKTVKRADSKTGARINAKTDTKIEKPVNRADSKKSARTDAGTDTNIQKQVKRADSRKGARTDARTDTNIQKQVKRADSKIGARTDARTDKLTTTMVVNTDTNKSKENRKVGESLKRYTDWYTNRGTRTEDQVPVTENKPDMQQNITANQTRGEYQVFSLPTSKNIFSQKSKKSAPVVVRKEVARSTSAPPVTIVTGKQGVFYTKSHYLGGMPHPRNPSPSPVRTYNVEKTASAATPRTVHTTRIVQTQAPPTPRPAQQQQPVVHVIQTHEQTAPQPPHPKPSNPVYHIQYVPQTLQYRPEPQTSSRSTYNKVHVHSAPKVQYSPRNNPPSPQPAVTPRNTHNVAYNPPVTGHVYTYGASGQRASQYRPKVLRTQQYSPNYAWNASARSPIATHAWKVMNEPNGEYGDWITQDADNKTQTVFFGDDDVNDAAVKIEVEETFPKAVNIDIRNEVNTASSSDQRFTSESVQIIDFVEPEGHQENTIPPLPLSTPRSQEQEVTMSLDEFLGAHGSDTNTSSHTSSLSDTNEAERRRSLQDGP